jgi:hypothetical protein
MTPLQSLRQARTLLRWVVAVWCLALGVAVASPLLQPHSTTLVCSATGMVQLVDVNVDPTDPQTSQPSHSLDCVLCLPVAAPAPDSVVVTAVVGPLTLESHHGALALPPSLSAAPPPGRGPPLFI